METTNRDQKTGVQKFISEMQICYQEHQNSFFMQQLLPKQKKINKFWKLIPTGIKIIIILNAIQIGPFRGSQRLEGATKPPSPLSSICCVVARYMKLG